jgi:glucan phosphoethanolaminetransferase (alkaline phosphatase superfamily)
MTPYERSIIGPLKILAAVCLLQALYFLFVGILRRRLRALSLWLGIGAAAAVVVAPILLIPACPDLNLCRAAYERITHTRMDHGEGG